jgi:aryl-alcohol dehydrogenase-like predicted oxidoreductase
VCKWSVPIWSPALGSWSGKDPEFDTIEQLSAIASDAGIDMVELAIAWVLANRAGTAPIVGARKPEQLIPAIAALDVQLDNAILERLDDLTNPYRQAELVR